MTADRPDNDAFELAGGRTGCLLLHGFTGTPYEMRYLGQRLHDRGYTVRGVRLPGHAVGGLELVRSGWRDWYGAALDGLQTLSRVCDDVFVIGLSMGALLAVKLAGEQAESVEGMALLAPAFVLRDERLRRYAPFVRPVLPFLPMRWLTIAKNGSDILDERARAIHPRFPVPLRGLVELATLQRLVRPLLPRVRQPVLIVHGRQDHTCPVENAEIVRREIGSSVIRCRILERSAHVVTVDTEKDQVVDEVAAFVGSLSSQERVRVG